jgi:hypothetical protein
LEWCRQNARSIRFAEDDSVKRINSKTKNKREVLRFAQDDIWFLLGSEGFGWVYGGGSSGWDVAGG